MKTSSLDSIIQAQKRGEALGITSVCSAHPSVLAAALRHGRGLDVPVLIEATCNQVNQFGGYTGLTPATFVEWVRGAASSMQVPLDRVLLGGDHLGPSVWQAEPVAQAMDKARRLVRDYVQAGFTKLHLDATMHLGDDSKDIPLPKEISAQRSADLAYIAEATYRELDTEHIPPRYVIGTEVPPPGGIQGKQHSLAVTTQEDVAETIEITRRAFVDRGLNSAWERVIAVVVQPGVEYGDETIVEYNPMQAQALSSYIEADDRLVYEAHSTDYQTREALRWMVRDHFAILKVGPALTYAFREAVFALTMIEEDWLARQPDIRLSHLRDALDAAMLDNPRYWQNYYNADATQQRRARQYSFSDRCRYYWPTQSVQAALNRLLTNLFRAPIPLTLLSQYLPAQYGHIREGQLANDPYALIDDKIIATLADYSYACGYLPA